ncbi:MAG: CopD family protein [Candidatus Eremiobacteraeota bacterium]|nr:CopD family protein [Candidatus Eremiobacteraeota bacterium]
MIYQALKVVHIVSVLVWVAGMFRLFDFYQHAGERTNERTSVLTFDSRWTTPAMLAAWLAGGGMAVQARWGNHSWFLWKFLLVVSLSGLHGVLIGRMSREQDGELGKLHTWWLLVPLLTVVWLVVVKP